MDDIDRGTLAMFASLIGAAGFGTLAGAGALWAGGSDLVGAGVALTTAALVLGIASMDTEAA